MALLPARDLWTRTLGDLIRFRVGETELPAELIARVPELSIFNGLDARAVAEIAAALDWLCLPGNRSLLREGEDDRALFIVLSGGLGVFVKDDGGVETQVAAIGPGETVGEMSLLSDAPHSAELVALRDTELLRLPQAAFERLIGRYPRFLRNIAGQLVKRLRQTTARAAHHLEPRSFALISLSPDLDPAAMARLLAGALGPAGKRCAVLDATSRTKSAEALHGIEQAHDLTLYAADAGDAMWVQAALRQGDRVLVLMRAGHEPEPGTLARLKRALLARHHTELIVVHEDGRRSDAPPLPLVRESLGVEAIRHLRPATPDCVARLARHLAGLAVTVVFAGGGARGFAHLGVLKALSEAKVPIDAVAGVSIGAIVAASVAAQWTPDAIMEAFRKSFVATNPLSDFTLPLVSLVRGRKVNKLLRDAFGHLRIEDLTLPFFCVSANLTTGRPFVHDHGLVWQALRASIALPGILPPVAAGGALLVDGGVVNNLPADIVRARGRGAVIGIDVAGDYGLMPAFPSYDEAPLWRLLRATFGGAPGIVSFLMTAGSLGSETRRAETRAHVDLLFDPPMPGIGLTSWKKFDEAVEAGYRHAWQVLADREAAQCASAHPAAHPVLRARGHG